MRNIIIAMLLTLFFISGCVQEDQTKTGKAKEMETTDQPIGEETDEHGCLGAAGYTWNEDVGACVREWELDEDEKHAAQIVVAPLSYPVTIVEVISQGCENCFLVKMQRNDNQKQFSVNMNNWKVTNTIQEQEFECNSDEDCIPLPSDCHPMICINKEYESDYERPEMCTEIFALEAAYTPEDCLCVENKCVNKNLGRGFEEEGVSLEEARKIAEESECTEKGNLTDNSFYNNYTKTWWIDLEMKEEFKLDYCNPACVVNEKTRTAEINWRCTGALP